MTSRTTNCVFVNNFQVYQTPSYDKNCRPEKFLVLPVGGLNPALLYLKFQVNDIRCSVLGRTGNLVVGDVTSAHSTQCGENTRALCMHCKQRGRLNLKKATCAGKQLIKKKAREGVIGGLLAHNISLRFPPSYN